MIIDRFDTDKKVFIIAEIGNNHEGRFSLAKEMIVSAAKAGANAVKFQTIIPEQLVSASNKDRIKKLRQFQFSISQFRKLARKAAAEGIIFMSTPFDIKSVSLLRPLVPVFKIASGDNNHLPLIESIAETGKPILLSTGLIETEDVNKIKFFIYDIWRKNRVTQELAVLHCVSNYPTLVEDANLLAIRALYEQVGLTVGYSDHTIGIESAVLSIGVGARIIEKHFTLNKNFSDFRDHKLSADPHEFAELVQKVRAAEKMLGKKEKIISEAEREMTVQLRRSIAAKKDMKKGTVITIKDLAWVRPGVGLNPGLEDRLINKQLIRDIGKGEKILPEYVRLKKSRNY